MNEGRRSFLAALLGLLPAWLVGGKAKATLVSADSFAPPFRMTGGGPMVLVFNGVGIPVRPGQWFLITTENGKDGQPVWAIKSRVNLFADGDPRTEVSMAALRMAAEKRCYQIEG